jgi:hypothetical protein
VILSPAFGKFRSVHYIPERHPLRASNYAKPFVGPDGAMEDLRVVGARDVSDQRLQQEKPPSRPAPLEPLPEKREHAAILMISFEP